MQTSLFFKQKCASSPSENILDLSNNHLLLLFVPQPELGTGEAI